MRPEAQLFFHVLGATVLFGATGAVAVLAFAGRMREEARPLAHAALATLLALAVPAWIVTFVFGLWTESAGNWPEGLTWIAIGLRVNDAGLVVLLASAGIAYRWMRRPAERWAPTVLAILACLYLVGLAVAWWVMTTKLPA